MYIIYQFNVYKQMKRGMNWEGRMKSVQLIFFDSACVIFNAGLQNNGSSLICIVVFILLIEC